MPLNFENGCAAEEMLFGDCRKLGIETVDCGGDEIGGEQEHVLSIPRR